jgi:FkbM family methyltransferase
MSGRRQTASSWRLPGARYTEARTVTDEDEAFARSAQTIERYATSYHLERIYSPRRNLGLIAARDGTSDMSVVFASLSNDWTQGDDEYRLGGRRFDGTFVDVGAHIGAVATSVLLDNNCRAILVEPVRENVELLRATIAANGWGDRTTIVEAAVGKPTIRLGTTQDDRYVANIGYHDGESREVPIVSLPELVAMAGGHINALKTDCEGGEWGLFASGGLESVGYIFGEWHGHNQDFSGPDRLHHALDPTHDITSLTDDGGIGLFAALRR